TQGRVQELRALLRAQKETLRSEAEMPSISAIQERLQIEGRLAAVADARQTFKKLFEELAELAEKWKALQSELGRLGAAGLSLSDRDKLSALEVSFLSQLREYGFSS